MDKRAKEANFYPPPLAGSSVEWQLTTCKLQAVGDQKPVKLMVGSHVARLKRFVTGFRELVIRHRTRGYRLRFLTSSEYDTGHDTGSLQLMRLVKEPRSSSKELRMFKLFVYSSNFIWIMPSISLRIRDGSVQIWFTGHFQLERRLQERRQLRR